MSETHITGIKGKYYMGTTAPSSPQDGERYFNISDGILYQYDATNDRWLGAVYSTTSTSTTSTSTTSTSSSTTSTSSTSSSSSTTSTSTSI
jgi:hypothetical protein